MAIRPALRTAVAGNKIKASEYNDNFTDMLNYLDDVVDDMEDYVASYMPTQTGQGGKYLSTNGTSATWTDIMPTLASLPSADVISGLVITKNSSSPNDTIDVSSGSCFDSTKVKILELQSAKTKQNDSQAVNTTYYVYLIAKSDLSAYDILITTVSSSPTLPTNYTYYRQIGSYSTNGEAYIDEIYNYSNDASISSSFYPDYSTSVSISSFPYTFTSNGWVRLFIGVGATSSQGESTFYINGISVRSFNAGNAGVSDDCWLLVKSGDVLTYSTGHYTYGLSVSFYKFRGA